MSTSSRLVPPIRTSLPASSKHYTVSSPARPHNGMPSPLETPSRSSSPSFFLRRSAPRWDSLRWPSGLSAGCFSTILIVKLRCHRLRIAGIRFQVSAIPCTTLTAAHEGFLFTFVSARTDYVQRGTASGAPAEAANGQVRCWHDARMFPMGRCIACNDSDRLNIECDAGQFLAFVPPRTVTP